MRAPLTGTGPGVWLHRHQPIIWAQEVIPHCSAQSRAGESLACAACIVDNDTTLSLLMNPVILREHLPMGAASVLGYSSCSSGSITRHYTIVGRSVCRSSFRAHPLPPQRRFRNIFVSSGPNGSRTTNSRAFTQSARKALESARSTSTLKESVVTMEAARRGIKESSHPPSVTAASPLLPLAQDFARQQVSKQQHNNFHSSSISPILNTMVSQVVNKTNLHPGGLQYVNTCFVLIT